MDWVSNSNPFIHPDQVAEFNCEDSDPTHPVSPEDVSQACEAVELHSAVTDLTSTNLLNGNRWNTWTSPSSALFNPGHGNGNPSNGFCILFIPRAAKFQLPDLGAGAHEDASGFTDLPIKQTYWKKVAKAFYLPGHFHKAASRRLLSVISVQRTCDVSGNKNKVWMHTATAKPDDRGEQLQGFAIAATHIESRSFTYAVMVGCSSQQIRKVKKLVGDWKESARHPLLMLGVCAELHLDRLAGLVADRTAEYENLMDELNGSMNGVNGNKFHWPTIRKVQVVREKSKKVEEDINTTRSQLSKACLSGVEKLLKQYETPQASSRSSNQAHGSPAGQTPPSPAGHTPSSSAGHTPPSPAGQTTSSSAASQTTAPSTAAGAVTATGTSTEDDAFETTALLNERFQDILSRLDGLAAECRLCVEGISFSTDVIRSELARQEAATSADNTAYGTAFALMAAVYLPTTAVATIFAMPIFGWTNYWRDWRYHPVMKSSSSSGGGGSDAGDQGDQPVVSGYVWLWFAFSAGLSLLTFIGFYRFTYRKLHRSKRRNPDSVDQAGYQPV